MSHFCARMMYVHYTVINRVINAKMTYVHCTRLTFVFIFSPISEAGLCLLCEKNVVLPLKHAYYTNLMHLGNISQLIIVTDDEEYADKYLIHD